MTHGILMCSCGRIILQCRCIGPHTPQVIPNGCERCKLKKSCKCLSTNTDLPELHDIDCPVYRHARNREA